MKNIAVIGSGKIGSVVANLLAENERYHVIVVDKEFKKNTREEIGDKSGIDFVELDINDEVSLEKFVTQYLPEALVSCLPYHLNKNVALCARRFNLHYFDLTEDVAVTNSVRKIAEGAESAFVPQCGVAPGFINIAGHTLAQEFDEIDTIKMRVGALPLAPNNILKYSLTWSSDGLINQYGNACPAIRNGNFEMLQPLEGLESVSIEGEIYECFNTSGGIGTMANSYKGKAKNVFYKTIRYPGHCNIMRLLINDFKLNEKRHILKEILENAVPSTKHDFVLIYVTVNGSKNGDFFEESYIKRIYNQKVNKKHYTGIQLITAGSLCAVLDIVLNSDKKYKGFVCQEEFTLNQVFNGRFGYLFN